MSHEKERKKVKGKKEQKNKKGTACWSCQGRTGMVRRINYLTNCRIFFPGIAY